MLSEGNCANENKTRRRIEADHPGWSRTSASILLTAGRSVLGGRYERTQSLEHIEIDPNKGTMYPCKTIADTDETSLVIGKHTSLVFTMYERARFGDVVFFGLLVWDRQVVPS